MEMAMAALLVLLLCSASTSFLPSHAAATLSPAAVLDVDGQSLRTGLEYYVLPVFRGMGGGLTIGDRGGRCPLYVVQEDLEVDPGLPVTFTPVNPDDEVVRTLTDLNVRVSAITTCIQSNVWRLGEAEYSGHRYVAINGDWGNPGKDTLSSWFNIEKYGDSTDHFYKLVFCPTVCEICKPLCGDLGVFIEGNKRWLGITGDMEFPVQFRLAAKTSEGMM